jgi:adenylate cyclase
MDSEDPEPTELTAWQRVGKRMVRRETGRREDEPLEPEDWEAVWKLHESGPVHAFHRVLFALPSSPRCGICGAPFAGVGSRLAGPLGYRPSRKNPTVCGVCVESSPPGGMKMPTGVLFADLRGFTARSQGTDPEEVAKVLRRFYRAAEDVLFPDAVIDKLIGDEVMALYLPVMKKKTVKPADVPALMLEHAGALLRAVGHGSSGEPFVEMGVGLDFGEAFVGNIGQRALYDFTAVGDVVNTASRLQGQAGPGEIVLSDRVARGLPSLPGEREELTLKGKDAPEVAYRVRV